MFSITVYFFDPRYFLLCHNKTFIGVDCQVWPGVVVAFVALAVVAAVFLLRRRSDSARVLELARGRCQRGAPSPAQVNRRGSDRLLI